MQQLDAVAAWLNQLEEPSVAQEVTCYVVWILAFGYILYCEHHPVQSLSARLLLWLACLALTPLYLVFFFVLGYPVIKNDHEFHKQFGRRVNAQ